MEEQWHYGTARSYSQLVRLRTANNFAEVRSQSPALPVPIGSQQVLAVSSVPPIPRKKSGIGVGLATLTPCSSSRIPLTAKQPPHQSYLWLAPTSTCPAINSTDASSATLHLTRQIQLCRLLFPEHPASVLVGAARQKALESTKVWSIVFVALSKVDLRLLPMFVPQVTWPSRCDEWFQNYDLVSCRSSRNSDPARASPKCA